MKIKHLDLFSGIGGFAYSIDQVWDAEHIFCEIDPFCQQILKKHWPHAKIYGDIKKLKKLEIGTIDLLTGGFPCQPFSQAGKRRSQKDDRFLWPEMLSIIKETKPTWIVGENVTGIIELALEQVCLDLESEGYEVRSFVIPACAINAIHNRSRVWIVAYHEGKRWNEGQIQIAPFNKSSPEIRKRWSALQFFRTGDNSFEFEKKDESFICGMDDGLPNRVDRFKALGNAIVPQVVIEIFKSICLLSPN